MRALTLSSPADSRRTLLAIGAVWSLVALVAALQTLVLVRLDSGAETWRALATRLSIIPLWAAATPWIFRSARARPVVRAEGAWSWRHAVLHAMLGSAFIIAANVAIRVPLLFAAGGGVGTLAESTGHGLAVYFPLAFVVYAVIVGVGHLPRLGEGGSSSGRATGGAVRVSAIGGGSRAEGGPPESQGGGLATAGHNQSSAEEGETARAEGGAWRGAPPESQDRVLAPSGHNQILARAIASAPVIAATRPSAASAALSAPIDPTIEPCLPVRQWNRTHLVRVAEIDWIEAEDNYVVVHAAGRRYKGRERLSDVEARLDARRFVRIHRSSIVHVARIRELQPLTHGDQAVVLRDGTVLRVARSRRRALEELLALSAKMRDTRNDA